MANNGKNKAEKASVAMFTAAWLPPEGEKEDGNCSVSGMIQVIGTTPTTQRAYLTYRDRDEDGKPCW